MHFLNKNDPVGKGLVSLLLLLAMAGCAGPAEPVELNVSAGYGLIDALKEINELYMQNNGNIKIIANFAAAGTLQKQIEQGAPADVFISPGMAQMDALQKGRLIIDESRQNLLTNKIVLVVLSGSSLAIDNFTDLTGSQVNKIAIGDPAFVPAGSYAQQAFDFLGITAQVKPKLILGADVRQVLTYVEGGNVDAGIVYATDAAISTKVKVAAIAPDEINNKVMYPLAVIKASKNPDAAKAYINFLCCSRATAIFEKYGFSLAAK